MMCDTWEDCQSEWEELLRLRPLLQDDVALTQPQSHEKASARHREALRAYWRLEARALRLMIICQNKFGKLPTPFPATLLMNMSSVCDFLGGGTIPRCIEDAKSEGGRPLLPSERKDIARAVHFLIAVEEGVVSCRSPVQTVAECFNVTKQTVRNWRKRSDEICWDVERAHPNVIEEAMRNCGWRYSRIGRGAPSS